MPAATQSTVRIQQLKPQCSTPQLKLGLNTIAQVSIRQSSSGQQRLNPQFKYNSSSSPNTRHHNSSQDSIQTAQVSIRQSSSCQQRLNPQFEYSSSSPSTRHHNSSQDSNTIAQVSVRQSSSCQQRLDPQFKYSSSSPSARHPQLTPTTATQSNAQHSRSGRYSAQ
jgi:hypothetical protein